MKYDYREGVEKQKSRKWVFFPLLGIFAGVYVAANAVAPTILEALQPADRTAKKLVDVRPIRSEDRVYIPKINVDIPILSTENGEKKALEKGAINLTPESGDPKEGGNYVVAAHRFNLGLTPFETKAQSPFYHLSKLEVGDDVYIDFAGQRYAYKVSGKNSSPDAGVSGNENDTAEHRLTLTTPENSSGLQETIEAKPVGKIVWQGGKPRLKSL